MPRILIVEDEGVVAADIAMSLRSMGYEVAATAATAGEALSLAGSERPDIVLMDIMLGGGPDGIEAAEKIRSELDIPVIFVTAFADDETLDRAKVTEPFGYIVKPIDDRELHISIEMALYKHRMEMERKRLTEELRSALDQVKTLKGLLPICAWCKKIRDDKGYWDDVEAYVQKHTDATFTHGICPDCIKKMEAEEKRKKK
jgi:CheY-like chemotaxis protein